MTCCSDFFDAAGHTAIHLQHSRDRNCDHRTVRAIRAHRFRMSPDIPEMHCVSYGIGFTLHSACVYDVQETIIRMSTPPARNLGQSVAPLCTGTARISHRRPISPHNAKNHLPRWLWAADSLITSLSSSSHRHIRNVAYSLDISAIRTEITRLVRIPRAAIPNSQ